MAHPKRRISTARRDKRRSHDFGTPKTITTDPTTGEIHAQSQLQPILPNPLLQAQASFPGVPKSLQRKQALAVGCQAL